MNQKKRKELDSFINTLDLNNKVAIVAVSGGPDSLFLTYYLNSLKDKLNFKLIMAHVNHHLRKESDEEEKFLKNYAEINNLIFEKYDFYGSGSNFEEEARKARYRFFEEVINKYQASYLFLGHHLDDLLETLLMKMVRGVSLSNLPSLNNMEDRNTYKLIRPLTSFTKEEIVDYLDKHNLKYFIDKSNQDNRYTRNRYRNLIIPYLLEENKNVRDNFKTYNEDLYLVNDYLDEKVNSVYKEAYKENALDLKLLKDKHPLIRKMVIKKFLSNYLMEDDNKLNKNNFNDILKICNTFKGSQEVVLNKNRIVIREYDKLYFKDDNYFKYDKIKIINRLEFLNFIFILDEEDESDDNYILRLNSKDITLPLYLKLIDDNDYLKLKDLGTKKGIDIFKENKILRKDYFKYPLIIDSKGEVLMIIGLKKAGPFKKKDDNYDTIIKVLRKE